MLAEVVGAMRMTQLSDSKPRYTTETFDCIVELARSIRPQWDVPGLRKAIRDALARDDQPTLAEIAYAVIRVAENFSVNSPAVIPMDGPHWRKAVPERVPPSAVRCPRCGSVDMPDEATRHRCKSRSERVASYVERMRATLAESRRGEDEEEAADA